MSIVCEFSEVAMAFRGQPLFSGVSFSVSHGERWGIRGANGSGKSVLLRLMTHMLAPTSGTVSINPRYLDSGRTFPDRFGVTIDGPAYQAHLSGAENLRALGRIRGRSSSAAEADLMSKLGLDPGSRVPVRRYSSGMKQKLSLCQALMEDPEVLILDEPSNALDSDSVRTLQSVLDEFTRKGGTVVMTGHQDQFLDEQCDRFLRIDGGRVFSSDQAA